MIEHNVPQGSPEWKRVRAGCITASNFEMIMAKVNMLTPQQATYVAAIKAGAAQAEALAKAGYKAKPSAAAIEKALAGEKVGDWSDAAKNYAFRLAIERISGEPLDGGYETWQMERGHELEPQARAAHEEMVGDMVREVGFITTDDGWFGASADGFRVANDRGCEYKCFLAPEKLREILLDGDVSTVRAQCQGGMWLSVRKAWEFGLYCPALAPANRAFTMFVIERDENFIEEMELVLMEFRELVMDYEAQLRADPAATPGTASETEAQPQQVAFVARRGNSPVIDVPAKPAPADIAEPTF